MIGKRIGKYQVIAQLGRGTTGIVYKAVDETLNRPVALKILNPEVADTEVMKRFRAEATILAKLNHPEIATIYELVRFESGLLMVMEFVAGGTLEAVSVRLGPMPPDSAAYLVDRILAGLEYAHRAGVVHRDMKPANVMVTDLGGVKIMDFGVARVRGIERMTIDRCMMGTPAYMAPEQVLGDEVDGRADVYSVGVMLYRLLTGVLPFTADHAIGMLQKQITQSPPPLSLHRPELPEWCQTIVERALAKSAGDRFQSAGEFRTALSRAAGVMPTTDLAKVFAVEDAALFPDVPPSAGEVLPLVPYEATLQEPALVGGADTPPQSSGLLEPAHVARSAEVVPATLAAGQRLFAWMRSAYAAPVAGLTLVASITWYLLSAESPLRPAAATFPPLTFQVRTLISDGQERDARLDLAEGRITVSTRSVSPLHTVSYDHVISITYSHGRDPLWNSPEGATRVARVDGGTLGKLGISVQRHWISVETNTGATSDRFIVLHLDEALVRDTLAALGQRTGRTPHIIGRTNGR